MNTNNLLNDLKGLSRAVELIFSESLKYQTQALRKIWNNSSVKQLIEEKSKTCGEGLKNFTQKDINHVVKETTERASMVFLGLKEYTSSLSKPIFQTQHPEKSQAEFIQKNSFQSQPSQNESIGIKLPKGVSPEDLKISELHHKDKELIEKLEKEFEQKLKRKAVLEDKQRQSNMFNNNKVEEKIKVTNKVVPEVEENIQQPTAKKFIPKKLELNPDAKQRKVPSTRIGRMVSFGSLAAGLGIGAIAEATRRTLGVSTVNDRNDKHLTLDQLFLTEANAERIVNTLCRVRGAALKMGQILSIQDSTIISPVLQKAFERVRQSADFMPTWQVQKVLVQELGHDWRDKLSYFKEKPFAAASIGQVHHVILKDGRDCAMKIQYPGVAEGIESDINNLVSVMKIWNIFPKGLFIDNLVEVAKRELAWEVDYAREAECTKTFKSLLKPYPEFIVPDVIDELSTKRIFTSTFIEGIPVDQCAEFEMEHRERIAKTIMRLCLKEIFEFRYMQTDPNWSNFFYDPNMQKVGLLDFGATRSYEKEFVKKYIEVIKASADRDNDKVLKVSQEMGFLTGYESKSMADAHVSAVMILGEVFSSEEAFDFGKQDTTLRIQKLIPTIVAERLCPPPEEIYSLHRKLSGVFLLCAKLKVKISCREMFLQVYEKFKGELEGKS